MYVLRAIFYRWREDDTFLTAVRCALTARFAGIYAGPRNITRAPNTARSRERWRESSFRGRYIGAYTNTFTLPFKHSGRRGMREYFGRENFGGKNIFKANGEKCQGKTV